MQYTEGRVGRVFVLRLEDGDELPTCVERFAAAQGIGAAQVILLGGIADGALVAGPRESAERPPRPVELPVEGAHEAVGLGVLAPDEEGRPALHLHAALGRTGQTRTGCLRPGVRTWLVAEVVVQEILDVTLARRMDPQSGFALLAAGPGRAAEAVGEEE